MGSGTPQAHCSPTEKHCSHYYPDYQSELVPTADMTPKTYQNVWYQVLTWYHNTAMFLDWYGTGMILPCKKYGAQPKTF